MNIKTLLHYLPACISGTLLVLCFPTIDLYGLAWIALVPFLLSLYDKHPKQAFTIGILFGVTYFFGTLYWIYHSVNHYGGVSFVASIVTVLLLCLYLSLYTGTFAFLFSLAIKTTRFPALFIAPVFWVVLEFLRSYIFTGFPWSSIGYTQYQFLPAIQFTDITGIYGISFFVVSVNGAIADIFLIRRRIRDMPLFPMYHSVIGLSVLCVFIVFAFVYGHWRLGQVRPGNPLRASIVQGNIEQDKKWEHSYQNAVIETYKNLSLEAASSSPSLIVWPETSVPFFFNTDMQYSEHLIHFQRSLNTYLLFGSVLVKEQKGEQVLLSNSAILLDRDGMTSYVYDKIHLVPFGEYIPFRKVLFFIDKLVVGIGDYIHGDQYVRAETPFGGFAPLICYEIIFPGLVRKFYSKGGDFIVNITNDAWFGRTHGPYQHFSMAVFRAIENRKPVVRAANTGLSGFIDSNGRILSQTNIFQKTVLTQDIRTDVTKSFYTKYGDLFSYVCIVCSVILMANLFGKYRRR